VTISAKIIADSISPSGQRITTYELEYPRFIHAEFMTHRLFSRNAASSRAIPVAKAIELIIADTAKPIHWGKNQPGMSAKEECNALIASHSEFDGYDREGWWYEARDAAIYHAKYFNDAGYHKQIVNRLLEPFTHIKVVCTATEYDNFFWLRRHPDAQPEIQELAEQMWQAREKSTPVELLPGSWHVPYFEDGYWIPSEYNDADGETSVSGATLEDAIAISSSCCAQVSYRRLDDSVEKARDIYSRLVESKPVHASPFEHQATPIENPEDWRAHPKDWEYGVTHSDVNGEQWSGNLKGWIQNRQLIADNVCTNYDGNSQRG
jgi:thymidylate synthase ThyX